MMMKGSITIGLLILALGWWVLVKASQQKGNLQTIGKVIGWIIILVTVIRLLLATYFCVFRCVKGGGCGMMMRGKGRMHHGMMQKYKKHRKEAEKKEEAK